MKRVTLLLLLLSVLESGHADDAKTKQVELNPKPVTPPAVKHTLKGAPVDTADVKKSEDVKKTENQDGEKLAKKVLDAALQQQYLEEAGKVESAVVTEAPLAELANGDGDISTTGPCSADFDTLCVNVPPGEGRLASCIRTHLKDEGEGNVIGRRVSAGCSKALSTFFEDRGTNINKNLQFAEACKSDVKKLCSNLKDQGKPGAVIACLRSKKNRLSVMCASHVLKEQIAAANDFRVDPNLAKACSAAAEKFCANVRAGEGRQQDCLRNNLQSVPWDCQSQLFRQDVENSHDLRLNTKLFKACRKDQQQYCKGVDYGNNRVKDCLEEKMHESGFSTKCRNELKDMLIRRSADFRLDTNLKTSCAHDIEHVCGYQASQKEEIETFDGKVISCLQDFKDSLQVDECKQAVHKALSLKAEDIRFDAPLADSCYNDREQHCPGIVPGSARVIRCLQDHHTKLSPECGASLFDHEVRLAEEIDFQYPLKRACVAELREMCTSVTKGHARLIRCLYQKVDSERMGLECKTEVRRNMNRMAQDYRLNFRLDKACATDVSDLCKDVCASSAEKNQACGGTVLRCLQDNIGKISASECRDEVFYFVKMEVTDFHNDIMLAEACRQDVENQCHHVEAGDGRVLECLREHRSSLSEHCAAEEQKLSQIQAKDVRLRPRLMKLCGEEMVVFCKDIKPGGGRMFNCLVENVQKTGFSGVCRTEVLMRDERMKTDYRLDTGLATACEPDVEVHCATEQGMAHGQSEVLKCLVQKMYIPETGLASECEVEISRAVRMAFWDFKLGASLTRDCDEDVAVACPQGAPTSSRDVYTIGVVGRCLSKHLASGQKLGLQCRQLVTAAAPKDIRLYLQETLYPDGTPKAGTMRYAVSSVYESGNLVTLNGWVAVASMASLGIVCAFVAYWVFRRFTGLDRPYTQLVSPNDLESRR